ncbi:MAG: glycosyltransferase [Sandaracinobacter sp.]
MKSALKEGEKAHMEERVVINALNLSGRGGKTVVADCVFAFDRTMPPGWCCTVYVGQALDVTQLKRTKAVIVAPRWGSWLGRIRFELWGLRRMEAGKAISLFLSLQGASARIDARMKGIYCHQPLIFADLPLKIAVRHPRFAAQRLIYDLLYRFAIGPHDWVIVQQQWMRDAMRSRYGHRNIIVARPLPDAHVLERHRGSAPGGGRLQILAPAAAFPHKDVETIIAVAGLLRDARLDFELTLTIDPAEGGYAAELARLCADVPQIRLAGQLTRDEMTDAYRTHHLMLFTSRVESWGLPLSEGKAEGIGIVASDHPYAHEAVGTYDGVTFFPQGDAAAAARIIVDYWTRGQPLGHSVTEPPASPYAESWDELVQMLTSADFIDSAGRLNREEIA